jgi:peptide/nickel transport system permease protein
MSSRRPPLLRVGAGIVGAFAVMAIFAPVIAPYGPQEISGPALAAPSWSHLLGTNDVGQDIFSQLIWGARTALVVALPAAAIGTLIGLLVGGMAALLGGWVDAVLMRTVDLLLALPMLALLVLIAALVGPSQIAVIALIAFGAWPNIARVLRSQALTLARRGHIGSARGFGAGPMYMMRRHVAPELGPLLTANFVYWAGTAIILQSGLAFLGLSDPTRVSWGQMLNRALTHEGVYFSSEWIWWVLPVGIMITVVATGLTLVSLALVEPRANPRWNRAM